MGLPLPATEVPTRDARLPYGGALITGCTQQVAVLTMGMCRAAAAPGRASILATKKDGSMNRSTAAKSVWVLGEGVSTLAKALIEADEQLACGADLDRIRRARENLDAVAPGCLLVRMLDRQIATRVKARRIRHAEAASLRLSRSKTLASICTWRQHESISEESHGRRYLHGL